MLRGNSVLGKSTSSSPHGMKCRYSISNSELIGLLDIRSKWVDNSCDIIATVERSLGSPRMLPICRYQHGCKRKGQREIDLWDLTLRQRLLWQLHRVQAQGWGFRGSRSTLQRKHERLLPSFCRWVWFWETATQCRWEGADEFKHWTEKEMYLT